MSKIQEITERGTVVALKNNLAVVWNGSATFNVYQDTEEGWEVVTCSTSYDSNTVEKAATFGKELLSSITIWGDN
jgi:hypothetical protein